MDTFARRTSRALLHVVAATPVVVPVVVVVVVVWSYRLEGGQGEGGVQGRQSV